MLIRYGSFYWTLLFAKGEAYSRSCKQCSTNILRWSQMCKRCSANILCWSLVFHIASMYFRRWSLVIHVFHLYIIPSSQIFYYPQKQKTKTWIVLHICGTCFTTDTQYTHLRYFVPFFPLQLFEVVSCNHKRWRL